MADFETTQFMDGPLYDKIIVLLKATNRLEQIFVKRKFVDSWIRISEDETSSIFHNIPWCNFHHKYIFILESQFPTIWDQPAVQLILKVFYERSFCKKKVARKEWRFYSSPRNAMGRCNMAKDMCQKMEFNNSTECDALLAPYYLVDALWGQPIKLVQVASTSELCENQRNDLLFFEIVPCHFCGASEVQT